MSRMLKSLAPYWKSVVIIFVLLVGQAIGDLALPQYTSNIIDHGIQNGGVEHILPEKITSEEYETAKLFMTDDELNVWESCYTENGDLYELTEKNSKKLDEYDETMVMPLIINNMMSSMTETEFKSMLAEQNGMDASVYDNVSIDMIGQQMGITLTTFTQTKDDEDGNPVIFLTIHEGRFHQVKRMLEAVGNEVVFLRRITMGSLKLDDSLPVGEYRSLTDEEVKELKK